MDFAYRYHDVFQIFFSIIGIQQAGRGGGDETGSKGLYFVVFLVEKVLGFLE